MSNPIICPECGSFPMGTGCYHICMNSVHHYSPEQELADEASYGSRYDYYREGGFEDPDIYADRDDEAYEEEQAQAPMFEVVGVLTYDARTDTLSPEDPFIDDIPF